MGGKNKVDQVPTMTPEQKALLDSYMRGASKIMGSTTLGEGWGGPSDASYVPGSGPGGMPFDTGREVPTNPMAAILGAGMPSKGGAPIASSAGMPATNPIAPPDPFGASGYSNREQMVSPIVNPFRRNLGG